jgi:hypothetical protein
MASRWLHPRTAICSIAVEDRFGPVVSDLCASGFDFTWYFESVILTLPVTAFFLIWAVPRLFYLRQKSVKTIGGYWGIVKLVSHVLPRPMPTSEERYSNLTPFFPSTGVDLTDSVHRSYMLSWPSFK